MADLEAARRAKEALKAMYRDRAWYRGIGIAPADSGFAVRLNVQPGSDAAQQIPREFEGVPVEVVVMGDYEPRSADGGNAT